MGAPPHHSPTPIATDRQGTKNPAPESVQPQVQLDEGRKGLDHASELDVARMVEVVIPVRFVRYQGNRWPARLSSGIVWSLPGNIVVRIYCCQARWPPRT
jgi:hypothetical protein